MASAAERNTVWVGFMDTVPVIGTVKEMVEWVLALYEGNKVVVIEKEKAIFQLVREPLDKLMERLELTEKPEKAGAEASKPALMDIKEVKQDELLAILSYAKGGQKEPAKVPEKEKAERQKKLQELKEDLLGKIHHVNPSYRLREPLKEQLSRSSRGEHVFNNGILKFHLRKVLHDFFTKYQLCCHCDCRMQLIRRLSKHTLESDTEDEIQTNMKVDFDEDEFYVNANSILYGEYCEVLRTAFHNILDCRDPVSVPGQLKENLEFIIDNMNDFEIYVDQVAKVKWINNNGKKEKFDQVKDEVVNMYKNDRGWDWIIIVMFQLTLQFRFMSGANIYNRCSFFNPCQCHFGF